MKKRKLGDIVCFYVNGGADDIFSCVSVQCVVGYYEYFSIKNKE